LLKDAIDAFPGIFVAAAGNGGLDGIGDDNDAVAFFSGLLSQFEHYCCDCDDQNDALASFSNYGGGLRGPAAQE